MTRHLRWVCGLVSVGLLLALQGLTAGSASAAGWTTRTPFPDGWGRIGFGATKGASGLVYVIGGTSSESPWSSGTATVFAYSEASDTWTTRAPLPRSRGWLAAATLGGSVLAVGGFGPNGPQATVYAYNEATNQWANITKLPAPRYSEAVATSGGKLYVIGGNDANGAVSRTVFVYTPSTKTWRTVAQLPTSRSGFSAAVDNQGLIYVVGGDNPSTGVPVSRVDRYNPATNKWSRPPDMPTPRYSPAARRGADGQIYVLGGAQLDPIYHDEWDGITTVEAYNPTSNTWATKPSMPDYGAYWLGAVLGDSGALYAIGGTDTATQDNCCTNTVYAYK